MTLPIGPQPSATPSPRPTPRPADPTLVKPQPVLQADQGVQAAPLPAFDAHAQLPPAPGGGELLEVGCVGPAVAELQRLLLPNWPNLPITGKFDEETADAVRRCQHIYHLPETGRADHDLSSLLAAQQELADLMMLADRGVPKPTTEAVAGFEQAVKQRVEHMHLLLDGLGGASLRSRQSLLEELAYFQEKAKLDVYATKHLIAKE
ncbi:MAG: putative peptidoglycan binding domain [Cyanobacteria bacterium RYN_339]|nr:putative peptidoglycan binding domain [Cyanobacteria bacterium RYN_339]